MLRHGDARHVVPRREGHERLTVAGEQLIKQRPPGRVGQCPEHEIHVSHDRKPFGFLSTQDSRAGRIRGAGERLAAMSADPKGPPAPRLRAIREAWLGRTIGPEEHLAMLRRLLVRYRDEAPAEMLAANSRYLDLIEAVL